MEKVQKAQAAKKGNKTTEIIIGAANLKLSSAVKALTEGLAVVGQLEEKVQDGVLQVTDLEDKIGGLEQDFKNKKAQQEIDLKLAYDSKRVEFVQEYLDKNNLETITSAELQELKSKAFVTEAETQQAISSAVGAATSSMKKEHEADKKIAALEHEKKEASNVAEINQLKQQNKFLEDQLNNMRTLLNKQMEQETERAKHQPAIHLNGTNTGR